MESVKIIGILFLLSGPPAKYTKLLSIPSDFLAYLFLKEKTLSACFKPVEMPGATSTLTTIDSISSA
jgi:hypothetical protein